MFLKLVFLLASTFFSYTTKAQGVAINVSNAPPDPSALLDVSGQRGLLIPRLNNSERNNIALPATALLIFNIEAKQFQVNIGTPTSPTWKSIVHLDSANIDKQFWSVNGNSGTANQSFIGTADDKSLSFKINNTLRLFIDSTSNRIGLGTNEPKAALHINSTDAIIVPVGTTEQRPAAPVLGMIRFNSSTGKLEGYNNTGWVALN